MIISDKTPSTYRTNFKCLPTSKRDINITCTLYQMGKMTSKPIAVNITIWNQLPSRATIFYINSRGLISFNKKKKKNSLKFFFRRYNAELYTISPAAKTIISLGPRRILRVAPRMMNLYFECNLRPICLSRYDISNLPDARVVRTYNVVHVQRVYFIDRCAGSASDGAGGLRARVRGGLKRIILMVRP